MGRRNRRTVASFVTAASVLAVLFAAFFAVSDVLPIPEDFREILGLASADTTGVGDLDLESEAATPTADPLSSLEASSSSTLGGSVATSATASAGSEEPTATGNPDESGQPAEGGGSPDAQATSPGATTPVAGNSVAQIVAVGPSFPDGALMVFRYPTSTGFTVGYTRALDGDYEVDYYRVLIERIEALGSGVVLSSTTASTTADEYVASGLEQGAYRVSVTAVDAALGESAPLIGEVLVGHARPALSVSFVDPDVLLAVASGEWINWGSTVDLSVLVDTEAPRYKVHSTDLLGATTVSASIESVPPTATVIAVAGEGQREISVAAVDCYGLESTPTAIMLKVDRTAPTAVSLLRAVQPVGTSELRVSWVGSVDLTSGVSHYVVSVADADGTVVRRVSRSILANPYYRFTDLEFGYYDITVTAVDVAANEGLARTIASELSEDVADAEPTTSAYRPSNYSGGSSGGSSGSGDDGDSVDEPAGPSEPSEPATEPADGQGAPPKPIDTKINGSNRLYWLIGAAGLGIGLLMIYFTAVYRAFSKKDD